MPQFIGVSMPVAAAAGELTRGSFDYTTETKANDSAAPVAAFGVAVKYNSGATAVKAVSAGSDAAIGIAVRQYGQADNSGVQTQRFVTVLKRGYIAVAVPTTETITAGDQVYLKAADGSFTSASASGANTAMTGAFFCGPSVGGLVEVAYNI